MIDRMRAMQVNPLVLVVVLLLAVVAVAYALWLKPAQQEEAIKKQWNTPEAAARRARKEVSPEFYQAVQDVLAKSKNPPPAPGGVSR